MEKREMGGRRLKEIYLHCSILLLCLVRSQSSVLVARVLVPVS